MEVSKQARSDFISQVKWPIYARPTNCLGIQPLSLAPVGEARAIDRMRHTSNVRHAARITAALLSRFHLNGDVIVNIDRSAQNIVDWLSYLPAGCVTRMVSLGWHEST
jgi:hypothetical protein